MDGYLQLSDLVERLELDRRMTRFVLENATRLKLPKSGGRGNRRKFNLAEALRIATTVWLLSFRFRLPRAQEAALWIEEKCQGRDVVKDRFKIRIYYPKYLGLIMDPLDPRQDRASFEYYSFETGKEEIEPYLFEDDRLIPTVILDLGYFAQCLR